MEFVEAIEKGLGVGDAVLRLELTLVVDEVLDGAGMVDGLMKDNVLEELLLGMEEIGSIDELTELVELMVLEIEVEFIVIFRHLMLCQLPLLSPYTY